MKEQTANAIVSGTPRTDDELWKVEYTSGICEVVYADLARSLELENQDLQARVEELEKDKAVMKRTLQSCERFFVDPDGTLKPGESMEKDAALKMLNLVQSTIKKATCT